MSITSQLPPISLAQASATLRALAQASGQTVEARVLSQSSNGTTQVQIGRQVLGLALPESPPVGTTLTLSVQQAAGQLRLTVVATRPPAPASTAPPTGAATAPAASVQLSAAALSNAPGQHPTMPATSGQASAAQPVATQPAAAPVPPAGARLAPGYGPPPIVTGVASPQAAPVSTLPPSAATTPNQQAPIGTNVLIAPAGSAATPGSSPAPLVGPVTGGGSVGLNPASMSVITTPAPQGTVPNPPASTPQAAPIAAAQAIPMATTAPVRADIPYAVAAPATAPSLVTSVTGSAATALPPVGQAVSSSVVGQHAPSPNMPGTPGQPAAASVAATPSAPLAATPQAALSQMMHQSLPRQDSIVSLTTALATIVGKVMLPEPVAKAAQQVLAARVQLDGVKLSGAAIKAGVQNSGIFQEALLASGQGQAAAGDVKSALAALRQSLGAWLGNQTPVAQVSGVAPPARGQIPRARTGDRVAPDLPDDPAELGKLLLERTEAALSRLRLHQNASLPEPIGTRQDTQWSLDLPVVVAGQQHLLHLQIHGDADGENDRPEDRGWQVRFAINLADRGEVGAQISLRARTTGVLLWADQAETAASLSEAVDGLREAIGAVGLIPGAIVVRVGAPAPPQSQPSGHAGHYVDATR